MLYYLSARFIYKNQFNTEKYDGCPTEQNIETDKVKNRAFARIYLQYPAMVVFHQHSNVFTVFSSELK